MKQATAMPSSRTSFYDEVYMCVSPILRNRADAATHVKISQLVTSLQTSRQQDVFALLVPSCQQVVPNLLTTCNKLDENIRLVTRLF